MKAKISNTALLVFSLSAKLEAERKTLFGNAKRKASENLFHHLITGTKKLANESGLDVFWFDEKNQVGVTFGEKYANAFKSVFDKGYQNVVSIGNDSPELTSEILNNAGEQLKHNEIVIGPSLDGGIYLIGINKEAFRAEKFRNLSWTKKELFEDLLDYAKKEKVCFNTLSELLDLDNESSLYEFIQHSGLTDLVRFILVNLIIRLLYRIEANILKLPQVFKNDFLLRGPPSLLLNNI